MVSLGQSLKTIEIKTKINRQDLSTYKFLHRKETINKMKRQPTEWEKIFANDVTNKGLISKINKQHIKLNNNNKKKPQSKNGQKT